MVASGDRIVTYEFERRGASLCQGNDLRCSANRQGQGAGTRPRTGPRSRVVAPLKRRRGCLETRCPFRPLKRALESSEPARTPSNGCLRAARLPASRTVACEPHGCLASRTVACEPNDCLPSRTVAGRAPGLSPRDGAGTPVRTSRVPALFRHPFHHFLDRERLLDCGEVPIVTERILNAYGPFAIELISDWAQHLRSGTLGSPGNLVDILHVH